MQLTATGERDENVGSSQDAFNSLISKTIYSSVINLYPFNREAVHLGIRTVCPLCDKPVTRLDLHVSVPSLCPLVVIQPFSHDCLCR